MTISTGYKQSPAQRSFPPVTFQVRHFRDVTRLKRSTEQFPPPPTVDPPYGGWGYQGASPGNPVRDSLPGYWDEVYQGVNPCATPAAQVWSWYVQGTIAQPVPCQDPSDPNTYFDFEDGPSVGGVTTFDTTLAGVGCSLDEVAVNLNCNNSRFDIIPGTQFQYTEVGAPWNTYLFSGNVYANAANALNQAGTTAANFLSQLGQQAQNLINQSPVGGSPGAFQSTGSSGNTTSLTGYQLSTFFVSLDQFLSDSGFTPEVLAANGIGIAPASVEGVLDPADEATLSDYLFATTASGLAYSRVSKTFNGTVTITNISTSPISGPFWILFMGLPSGVTLANATGSFSGSPYLMVPAVTTLAAGQSATVGVQFNDPSFAAINFTPAVYWGRL
jgi:hypothetical protein